MSQRTGYYVFPSSFASDRTRRANTAKKTAKTKKKLIDYDFVPAGVVDEMDADVEDVESGPAFKPGDVVRLKSGGPYMTITSLDVDEYSEPAVDCVRFPELDCTGSGHHAANPERYTFSLAAIKFS
jgi:uncharacterized protein YodC (DUF2158 family)